MELVECWSIGVLEYWGENVAGIKEDENLAAITIRRPDGTEAVWPRLNLQAVETKDWSLMPTGLEEGLGAQDMADLLEYLQH